jgi:hypothetical protein
MKRAILLCPAFILIGCSAPQTMEVAATPGSPGSNVCLNVQDIRNTETPNDRTIVFYMRNGMVWRNTLKSVCPMLSVSPYTQKLQTDLVCANRQFIHVTMTGIDCVLGDFTPVPQG